MEILQNPDVVPSNHIMTGTLPHALFSVRAVWSQFKTVKNEACAIYPIGTEVAVFIWATVQRRSLFKVPACGVSRRASGGEFLPPPLPLPRDTAFGGWPPWIGEVCSWRAAIISLGQQRW